MATSGSSALDDYKSSSVMMLLDQEKSVEDIISSILNLKSSSPSSYDTALPDHLKQFKESLHAIEKKVFKLPTILSQLSPRSKLKISVISPQDASKEELQAVERYLKDSQMHGSSFYHTISSSNSNNSRYVRDTSDTMEVHNKYGNNLTPSLMKQLQVQSSTEVSNSSAEYFIRMDRIQKRKADQVARMQAPKKNISNSNSSALVASSVTAKKLAPLSSLLSKITASPGNDSAVSYASATSVTAAAAAAAITTSTLAVASPTSAPSSLLNTDLYERANCIMASLSMEALQLTKQMRKVKQTSKTVLSPMKVTPIVSSPTPTRFSRPAIPLPISTSSVNADCNVSKIDGVVSQYKDTIDEFNQASRKVLQSLDAHKQEYRKVLNGKQSNDVKKHQFMNQFCANVYDEIGVNLDEDVIRRRTYEKGLRLIIYYVYNFKIKHAWSWLAVQVKRATEGRITKASMLLCRIGRGMVVRQAMRRKHAATMARRKIEADELAREEAAARWMKATIGMFIKRAIKRFRKRREMRLYAAATNIQRIVRGRVGREKCAVAMKIAKIRRDSCIIIQCSYRCRLARRRCVVLRKIAMVKRWMELAQRDHFNRRMQHQTLGARLSIIRYYRAYNIRRKMKNIIYWGRYEMIVYLQTRVRGYLQRKKYRRVIKNKRLKQQLLYNAASTIQRLYRGYRDRRIVAKLRSVIADKRKKYLASKKEYLKRHKLSYYIKSKVLSMIPFNYLILNKQAAKLQRVWRGHVGRRRAFFIKMRNIFASVIEREKDRMEGVVLIQRIARGYIYRTNRKRSWRAGKCIVIQCFFRCCRARRRTKTIRAEREASDKLTKNFKILHALRKAYRARQEKKKKTKHVLRIQRLYMRYQGRQCMHARKARLRSSLEVKESVANSFNRLLSSIQLRIVYDCLESVAINAKYNYISADHMEAPCNGPVQALFVSALGMKGRTERNALVTNKMDLKMFTKLLIKIDGLTVVGKAASRIINRNSIKKTSLSLLESMRMGSFRLAECLNTPLSPTDVDIIFTKSIANQVNGNVLSYADFCNSIKIISELHYKPRTDISSLPRNRDMRLEIPALKDIVYKPNDLLMNGKLSLVLKMLFHLQDEPWMTDVKVWLQQESQHRLSVYAKQMQKMYHVWKSRIFRVVMADRDHAHFLIVTKYNAAVTLQCSIRRFIAKRKQARFSQKFYVKYIPNSGLPYWYNPSTRIKAVVKPKLLLHFECCQIKLPSEGMENYVKCSNCSQHAVQNCIDCQDSYCSVCYDIYHCKGRRTTHRFYKLSCCSNCKFQVATKSCLTCILQKPVPGSLQEKMAESERGLLCDTCFTYLHDQKQQQMHDGTNKSEYVRANGKKNHDNYILKDSKDAYLIKHQLSVKIHTNHKFDFLIQPCEECCFRCASWRCDDCQQVYCHQCITAMHSVGGPFSRHTAELLPYYTPDIHQSYLIDEREKVMHKKLEAVKKQLESNRVVFRAQSIVRIQTWWRMHYYGSRGKEHMHLVRRRMRRQYRLHKQEDITKRRSFMYRLKDFFGYAPVLYSDTKEEKILKRLPVWHRQRAREYVWKNKDDWAFYVSDSYRPQKGAPRLGFSVGSDAELIDQCLHGGYRLPGLVFLKKGKECHDTLTILMGIIKPGELIRIDSSILCVTKVEENKITFNRPWRAAASSKGSLMYRLPCYGNEDYISRNYYRYKFSAYSMAVANPVCKYYFKQYSRLFRQLATLSTYLEKANDAGSDDAKAWHKYHNQCLRKAQWAEMYIKTGGAAPDLSQAKIGIKVVAAIPDDPAPNNAESSSSSSSSKKNGVDGDDDGKKKSKTSTFNVMEMEMMTAVIDAREAGKRWVPTRLEQENRRSLEEAMEPEALAQTAADWIEELDTISGNIFYYHRETLEICNGIPLALTVKTRLEESKATQQAAYDEAQKKVQQKNATANKKVKLGGIKR